MRLQNSLGISCEICASGALRCLKFGKLLVNAYLGSEVEAGFTNLYLRRQTEEGIAYLPLLGPKSPAKIGGGEKAVWWVGEGLGVGFSLSLTLAEAAPAWFWQIELENLTQAPCTVDLIYLQDLALADYSLVRANEYFVSQYLDHTPLKHPQLGWVVASRQNLPQEGRHPWSLIGALGFGVSFATDALEVFGLALRADQAPRGIAGGLSGVRRQHEHALAAIQQAPLSLKPKEKTTCGFFGWLEADHPAPSSAADLELIECILKLIPRSPKAKHFFLPAKSLFARASKLEAQNFRKAELETLFPPPWRQVERDAAGRVLSFFSDRAQHVVLKAKELSVLRPHGHILRTGESLFPEEQALTSTVWMAGIFHSQLAQGHVARNLLLSTARGYLGQLSARGLRVFVELAGGWQLLDVPSVFAMSSQACRWLYRTEFGLIEVRSSACAFSHALSFELSFLQGPPCRCLIVLHLALGGDDGDAPSKVLYAKTSEGIVLTPPLGSDLRQRFPAGYFELRLLPDTQLERIGGDELLFAEGSFGTAYFCLLTSPSQKLGFKFLGRLIPESEDKLPSTPARISLPKVDSSEKELAPLLEILPHFAHNARIHYLSPRGLEQYTGGGWGARDVTQGPVEWLLAQGAYEPVREILRRVFANQNPDGSWPQWFSFYARDRKIRALNFHGDIVFWPLLALGRYLLATEDASLLEENLPFFQAQAQASRASLWQHVERALAFINTQKLTGSALVRYGLGDWDDSLEPAGAALGNELVSSFTVALHYQSLTVLAEGLHRLGQSEKAARLEREAAEIKASFRAQLIADGVLAGLVRFHDPGKDYLMHPRDQVTGVKYRLVSMVQAILAGLFTPEEARAHLDLIARHLLGPDGARLADRPLTYRGGSNLLFERAETASFFGREIGLMYTHAHLRYAEALALVGEAEGLLKALSQANPAQAPFLPRQANVYFTSSDATFADRYQAQAEYEKLLRGEVALEGGWRLYSSGPGVFLRLVISHLLGLELKKSHLKLDPVIPKRLDGAQVEFELLGHEVQVLYHIAQRGTGPEKVVLNGEELPYVRCLNPYRLGGVEVPLTAVSARLKAGLNRLTVWIG